MFLYFEPFAAFGGALLVLFQPIAYLKTVSPLATTAEHSPLEQPIYDQLAAHLLRFAWCLAVVLRVTTDIRIWKYILFGMLLCDVLHLYSSYQILGAEVFFDPRKWRVEDWVNFVMLYGPGTLRLGVCLGVGLDEGGRKRGKVQ